MLWLRQVYQLLHGDNALKGDLQLQLACGHLAGLRIQRLDHPRCEGVNVGSSRLQFRTREDRSCGLDAAQLYGKVFRLQTLPEVIDARILQRWRGHHGGWRV